MESNGKAWTERYRWVTPMLVSISIFVLGMVLNTTRGIDDKLFKHLTNDEIHTPKSVVLTRAEFAIYQDFRNKQNDDLKASLCRIEALLQKHMETK